MKTSSLKSKIALVLAENCLKDLEDTTSIGKGVLNAARPAVTRLFKELSEDRQALFMYLLKKTAQSHTSDDEALDVEKLAIDIPTSLRDIDKKGLEKMRRQVHYIHGVVANTMLVSYGGLGESKIAVEG